MARKLSSKQRKARKRASYIRSEYYKNFDAIDYLRNFGKVKDIKIPNKITKASLNAIRKAYKEARANLPKTDGYYVNASTGEYMTKLPTKEEMAKEVRAELLQAYRRYRARPEEPPLDFDPNEDYIDDMISKIRNMGYAELTVGLRNKKKTTFEKSTLPKLEAAKEAWATMIEEATEKLATLKTAELLASSPHIQRIEELQMKYAHEITEEINESALPWLEASIAYALGKA